MKNGLKKNHLFLTTILLSVFLISFVFAANTPVFTPAEGGRVNGSTFNISILLDTNGLNYDNASFYYATSGSDTWKTIGNDSNSSGNPSQVQFSIVWDTTGINDTNNVRLNVTLTNATLKSSSAADNNINSTTVTGLYLDNGVPSCSYASGSVADAKEIVWNVAGIRILTTADSSRGVNNCSLNFNGIVTNHEDVSNTCDVTTNQNNFSLANGVTYTYYTNVTDGNGNVTQCGARTIKTVAGSIGGGSSGGAGASAGTPQKIVGTPSGTSEGFFASITSPVANFFTQTIPNSFKSLWNAITFWN